MSPFQTQADPPNESIDDLFFAGDWDLEQQAQWNVEEPEIIDSCVHELVEKQAHLRPKAPAINAWDGNFTYDELNEAANRLAHHLVSRHQVQCEDLVLVCFGKSAWFYVSILAINKAGGAWVPLDPSHPPNRRKQIVSQTGSRLLLASPDNAALCDGLAGIVQVSPSLDAELHRESGAETSRQAPACQVKPHNVAYVLFTSGSTGTPKGLVMEHGAVCTSQTAIIERLGLTYEVRMLQFAAYVFDLSIGEIIAPLISGACLCVPSEDTRMNSIKEFINNYNVNWAFMTPSFARTLSPADIPGIELLLLAGEAVGQDIFETWFGKVRLINGWGPAETCVFSTLHEWESKEESPLTIGRPVGSYCWIIDPEDPAQLVPFGTLGEVVIQGPTLLREYLSDPERTRATTIGGDDLPQWASKRDEPHWRRFYKSGDLCMHNPDGTVEFISRKDTQVKVRGQRVELGEVEHHIRTALPDAIQVAVDAYETNLSTSLISYLCFTKDTRIVGVNPDTDGEGMFLSLNDKFKDRMIALAGRLSLSLPSYEVPSIFIPCSYMPFNTSGKLDRKLLRAGAVGLGREQLEQYSLRESETRPPETAMETRLQQLWAEVLNIPSESIGRDSSFFRIGGDSLAAIHLATVARDEGITLTVKDIFDDPRLIAVAGKAQETEATGPIVDDIKRFSLLEEPIQQLVLSDATRELCELEEAAVIEDAFPCTKLQESLMAMAVKEPGSYIAKNFYKLSSDINIFRFKAAWQRTVDQCTNLQTRILNIEGKSVQALVKEKVQWQPTEGHDLNSYISSTYDVKMAYGVPLCRVAIVEEASGSKYFVWLAHHAVFDGWSVALMMDALSRAYDGALLAPMQPYAGFVKYTTEIDNAVAGDYWRNQLRDAKRSPFPPVSRTPSKNTTRMMKTTADFPRSTDTSITKASILRAAWAIVLARHCDTEDICFGTTLSGRNAPVAGIEAMPGPAVATVPIRVRLDRERSVSGFLQDIQAQASGMVPFEQFGMLNISSLSQDAREACKFSSLLVIQPMLLFSGDDSRESILKAVEPEKSIEIESMQNYYTYPLVMDCLVYGDFVELVFTYHANVLGEIQIEAVSRQFNHVVQQLLEQGETALKDVSVASPWDYRQAIMWNKDKHDVLRACVHDLVSKQAAKEPNHEAIFSSEGTMSYGELDHASTLLGNHLSRLGVKPEVMVLMCFEKSKWAIVAMLGILKAGGVFIPSDPSHPVARRQTLVKESNAKLIVTSPYMAASCENMGPEIVKLSASLISDLSKLSDDAVQAAIRPTPSNTAYVLFTSGSTGKPKAIVVDHSALSSSIMGYGRVYQLSRSSRVLQFSNYVFDVSLSEILETLVFGGSVCVPTESERMEDLPGFATRAGVTCSMLTPSFLRAISPTDLPTLDLLLLVGEPPTRDVLQTWHGHVKIVNAYGPSEASIFCTSHLYKTKDESPTTVGRAFSGACWIVEPENHNQLSPIGCVGEILLQRHMARGYLNDDERTKSSFIHNVPFLPMAAPGDTRRFYKTGDLARFHADGTMEYLGRRDTQVKVRGYRIELGEIEFTIQRSLADIEHVAVDVIRKNSREVLAAFMSFHQQEDGNRPVKPAATTSPLGDMSDSLQVLLAHLASDLRTAMPGYMVPSLFLPLTTMPFITSMKMDRQKLRALALGLSTDEMATYSLSNREWVAPTTEMELQLRSLWADVLHVEEEEIGKHDNFLETGGDSITAIQLVNAAQKHQIVLTVAQIFEDPRLSNLAATAVVGGVDASTTEPFDLVRPSDVEPISDLVRKECRLSNDQKIDDIYPCTPLQEGLMALTVKQPGSYIAKSVFKLSRSVSIERFKESWEKVITMCTNLRTRIVLANGLPIQAVISGGLNWEATDGLSVRDIVSAPVMNKMTYGIPLCRFGLVEESNDSIYFVWVQHHSIFDGWASRLVFGLLYSIYHDSDLPTLQPYSSFIKYTSSIDTEACHVYWREELREARRSPYPPSCRLPDHTIKNDTRILKHSINFVRTHDSSITKASILRAAWAITLSQYADSNDIVFGATVSGRNAPVPGLADMPGPMIATVPVRVRLDCRKPLYRFLRDIQTQASSMVAYEQVGIQNISKLGPEAKEACDFSTLLVIQPGQRHVKEDSVSTVLVAAETDKFNTERALEGHFNYPLVIECGIFDETVELRITYHSDIVNNLQAEAISYHLDHVVQQILDEGNKTVGEVSVSGPWDFQKAMKWNDGQLECIDACAHDLVSQMAASIPQHQALYSTEVSMTYEELDRVTNCLASYLSGLGVRPESMVPFCFEKSIWAIVAMLGINKAGGVFIPLDPAHPINRRREIIDEIDSKIMLVSPANYASCETLVPTVIELSESTLGQICKLHSSSVQLQVKPSPSNAAYILFTSGSTGKPKGVLIEHASLCSSATGHGKAYGLGRSSRVFQFSSYAFDVCLGEIFTTLIFGGTVCVPNDTERLQDTAKFITAAEINVAMLTPSFLRTLNPDHVPCIKTMVIGGEPPAQDSLRAWVGRVRLINGYGPAEATIYCSTYTYSDLNESPTNIGFGANSALWVVQEDDYQKLTPIGCIGELLVEGHALARGYLNNKTLTDDVFIKSVPWLKRSPIGHQTRFYRSGDLVQYNPDGTLNYLGRRDTQVKVRGQRIELAEIEYAIKKVLPNITQAAADIINVENRSQLGAFVCFTEREMQKNSADKTSTFLAMDEALKATVKRLIKDLKTILPPYMIPSLFIPLRDMPFITSMKLDRKKLRTILDNISREELSTFSLASQEKIAPTTEMEFMLRDLWAQVLRIEPETIGKTDTFLEVGGDSISAIQLVSLAQQHGIGLAVTSIFKNCGLDHMAMSATTVVKDDDIIEPFSIMESTKLDAILAQVLGDCGFSSTEEIEDMYPCAPLQEGLMALAVKQPGSYVAKYIYRLSRNTDVARFKAAWEKTVAACGNLRTRIILADGVSIQAVMKEEPSWDNVEDMNVCSYMEMVHNLEMGYGSRLSRYALGRGDNGDVYFSWIMHHAVFDGWSMQLAFEHLLRAYHGTGVPKLRPYAGFIKYIADLDHDASRSYWLTQLDGAKRATFPPAHAVGQSKLSNITRLMKKVVSLPRSVHASITKATVLRAAWAIVLARYCDTDDICFGATMSGRNAPAAGLAEMPGPMIATVPVRVQLNPDKALPEFLRDIQLQASEMVAHEQYGLASIAKIGDDFKDACDFTSLVVVQPAIKIKSEDYDDALEALFAASGADHYRAENSVQNYFNYPLVVQLFLLNDSVEMLLAYDTDILEESQLEALANHFGHVVQQLLTQSQETLGQVFLSSFWDFEQAMRSNFEEPEIIESCVHQLIEKQAGQHPNAPAVLAWDGELSYRQLNQAANRLAHHLVDTFGIQPDDLVHVCFEKSAWFFVSIFAINKAGAAWVPFDPSHPVQRLQQIASKTQSKLVLASSVHASMCSDLLGTVLQVTPELDNELAKDTELSRQGPVVDVAPRNAVYALFTSGSTGTPKGFVMEHGSVCTSQTAIIKRMRLTSDVRMLQFASYVFDMSVGEILPTLISGGCVCVPSDEMRMNSLREYICDMAINSAWMTPAYARTLKPEEIPSLKLLVLAGEAVGQDILDTWVGKVRLINGWGPAETCVVSTIKEFQSTEESPLVVGKPVGGYCWIVDPGDPHRLAPTGCLGEVVIQSPTLLREYLADPDLTQATTIPTPDWAPKSSSSHWKRFYKSGDLGFYNAKGEIVFSTRKDTQVKIRGLRVELGEVEHHVRRNLPDAHQVAVDVFQNDAGSHLVAYFSSSGETQSTSSGTSVEGIFLPLEEGMQRQLSIMASQLSIALPRYMIPTIFIPCRYMPSITSTKLDRKTLKALTTAISRDDLAKYSLVSGIKRAPETAMEVRMQSLWSKILNVSVESIGRDDNFLRIGGDSITAIRLVTLAQQSGITVTVKDIFEDPRLVALSEKAVAGDGLVESNMKVEEFSLLEESRRDEILGRAMRDRLALLDGQYVEDAYLATRLQEGLMALAVKQPGSYIAKYVYNLPAHVEPSRFKAAWERTTEKCANLRTRIVSVGGEAVQVLVGNDAKWESSQGHNLRSFMELVKAIQMGHASRLCRYAMVEDGGNHHFVLVIHHAIFDGWTHGLVTNTLYAEFMGTATMEIKPFAGFIKYTMNTDMEGARQFWASQLEHATKATFPPTGNQSQSSTRLMSTKIDFADLEDSCLTQATIVRAAWAIVLARYCDSNDICFGATVSGRNAPVSGLETMAGPMVATVPVRVALDREKSISSFLGDIQSQATAMIPYEQYGMQNITRLNPEAKEACDFSSLLVIQPSARGGATIDHIEQNLMVSDNGDNYDADKAMEGYYTYPLVLQAQMAEGYINLILIYDSSVVSEPQMSALTTHFSHVMQQLLGDIQQPLSQISLSGPWDMQQALEWTPKDHPVSHECVHDLISAQARCSPNHQAVYSSDGSLSYAELDATSDRFANHLASLGVKPETMVPICLDKSIWTIVAMIGIMKAGGVFVPLDPSHPYSRRQGMVKESGASLMVVSPTTAASYEGLVQTVVELSADLILEMPNALSQARTRPAPSNAAYVLFTSGSTGKPKAIVMDHSALSSSIIGYNRAYHLKPKDRVLQFSSYVFDVSLSEILETLVFGGTVCVPSENQRIENLVSFIATANINVAMLTSSFLRTLNPNDVPTLDMLLLVGEPPTRDVIQTWFQRVKLINAYGPSEASIFCASHLYKSPDESPTTVGRAFGGACWIVEPDDPNQLAPIGCIGEILIQRHMARGYLNDEERSQRVFIKNVSWHPTTSDDTRNFYKTGDLARYHFDGTIEYLGRRDTQVKVRGYRIELGEIEYAIKKLVANLEDVAVDVIEKDSRQSLVSFMSFNDINTREDDILSTMSEAMCDTLSGLRDGLKATLPGYMMPNMFLPLSRMPRITSMKADRLRLRALAQSLSPEDQAVYSLANKDKKIPTTDSELTLRVLWSQVIGCSPRDIGKTDSFLQVGGDSIRAIQLAALAQERGFNLSVTTIFQNPALDAMALIATEGQAQTVYDAEPFTLIPADGVESLKSAIQLQCMLPDTGVIEDVYPCTPLQAALIALSIKQPGSYISQFVFRIPRNIETARFKTAWKTTIERCGNLRTRIVATNGSYHQAVIKNELEWENTASMDLATVLSSFEGVQMTAGSRLCRHALVEEVDGERYFVWVMHHAIFDGWSNALILGTLYKTYHGKPAQSLKPYSSFISYMLQVDSGAAEAFWKVQLQNAQKASFPRANVAKSKDTSRVMHRYLDFSNLRQASVTKASIMRAAWAIILARYCDTKDVCFGSTVSGRNAPCAGLAEMAGPAIATVPVRVIMDKQQPVAEFLQQIQDQATATTPYEQFGLQNIARLSPDAKSACEFSSLLVVQPVADQDDAPDDLVLVPASRNSRIEGAGEFFNYPLVLEGKVSATSVELVVTYHPNTLSDRQVEALSEQFSHVVQQLSKRDNSALLGNVLVAGPWDLQTATGWNTLEPMAVNACLHDMVSEQARRLQTKEAIFSSEGSMTYAKLDRLTDQIARYLFDLGVRPETKVPFCIDKSYWAILAMLGIMKAGGVFIPLDPSHPVHRREIIIEEVGARFLIVSHTTAEPCKDMVPTTVQLSPKLIAQLASSPKEDIPIEHKPGPGNAAYTLFTSGSTGKPKGIVIEHSAICTSLLAQGKAFGVGEHTRYLQFANYVFDASISEIFSTLMFGGTICIPNETERLQNVPTFMAAAQVNTALLTPSFVRTLKPEKVPSLSTLIIGGEASGKDTLHTWQEHVKLINAYGPTEACIAYASNVFKSPADSPGTIGRPITGPNWIVDPDNHNQLTPIGCVGELLVQSHALAREYIHEPEKTNEAFITDVDWLPLSKHRRRFYKTGDLVRYNCDGTMEYVGRRDSQLKLRGQRIEVNEIEYAIKAATFAVEHVAVDRIHTETGDALLAFLSLQDKGGQREREFGGLLLHMDDTLRSTITTITDSIRDNIPSYMVPSFFIPLASMPFVSSMKLDRKQLHGLASKLSSEDLSNFLIAAIKEKVHPTTEMEFKLRDLWAQILKISAKDIGKTDKFLEIGGDSITSIHLVSLAQEHGIGLTVSQIFENSTLSRLAALALLGDEPEKIETEPFGMIPPAELEVFISSVRHQCTLPDHQEIEDMFPCTQLQEGMMALAVKQPGSYIAKHVYQLAESVDTGRFMNAFEQTMLHCANLRTRICLVGDTCVQAIIKNGIEWEPAEGHSLDSFMGYIGNFQMQYGTRLSRYGLVKDDDGHVYFVWMMHHVVFDGWSVNLMMDMLYKAYWDKPVNTLGSYASFIKYTTSIDKEETANFWLDQLHNAKKATFPRTPTIRSTSKVAKKSIPLPEFLNRSVTMATVLRAAWALVLARYTDTDDICFGMAISGRNAPVPGLGAMAGMAVTTLPVRIRLDRAQTVSEYLNGVQAQAREMVPFEQFGLQNIAKLSLDVKDACDFSSLLVVQPIQKMFSSNAGEEGQILIFSEAEDRRVQGSMGNYFNYPLVLQGFLEDNQVDLHISYDPSVLDEMQVVALSNQFEHVLQQLLTQRDLSLGSLCIAGSWDLQQAIAWNSEEPEIVDTCVHMLIEKRAEMQPHFPAIHAWDGEFTYKELNSAANRLAHYLVDELNIQLDELVHVCFEKSAWYLISILAINKAGAAWVPLEPQHPRRRLQQVVEQTRARIALASSTHTSLCSELVEHVVEVTGSFDKKFASDEQRSLRGPVVNVTANNAAYVLFTSGSTGTPKGFVLEHGSVSTSQSAIGRRLKIRPGARTLQFASHVFDMSIGEIIVPLMFGACICVPSEFTRVNNIVEFIRETRVNWLFFTPAFARTIRPQEVPSVEVLVLAGEAVGQDLFDTWFGKTRFINAWGPAEVCVFATLQEWSTSDESPLTIGTPVGGKTWLVDPDDPQRLAPIGTVGEAVVQGPTILRKYLADPEKTRDAILSHTPSWVPRRDQQHWNRIFKTGDLCRYNSNGTIEFVSRKDA